MKQEYLSIKNLAKKYDISPDTIKRKSLIHGVHFIKIGKLIRYNVDEMHKLLTCNSSTDINIDKFLINTVELDS